MQLTDQNRAQVALTDPREDYYHGRVIETLADNLAIALAIHEYAQERGISPLRVRYTVLWPATDERIRA